MAITAKLYAHGMENLGGGSAAGDAAIDLLTDTIKVALCTVTYTPSQANHEWFSDITNEVVGIGYTAGGATLASKTLATSTLTVTFDAADVVWTGSMITARYAVIYKDTGVAGASPLIGYVDFDANVVSTGGSFTITWHANGIFTITVS